MSGADHFEHAQKNHECGTQHEVIEAGEECQSRHHFLKNETVGNHCEHSCHREADLGGTQARIDPEGQIPTGSLEFEPAGDAVQIQFVRDIESR